MPVLPHDLWRLLTDLGATARAAASAPGLGLSVFTSDEVVLERGFGTRDSEAGLPVTPATIFGVASITKSVTSLTTLLLQEQGLIDLRDRVDRYFDFGPFWEPGRAATVAQFLSHSGGLPASPTMTWLRYASQLSDPIAAGPTLAEAKLTLVDGALGMPPVAEPPLTLGGVDASAAAMGDDEALERLAALAARVGSFEEMASWFGASARPLAAAGELYSYSNDSYCLVGGMLEQVSGTPYAALVQRELLDPLGMRRSRFDAAGVTRDSDHATLYTRNANGEVTRSPAWQTTGVMQAGGMLKSTLRDLRAYVRHLMSDDRNVRAMTEPRVSSAPGTWYGLGLSVIPDYHGLTVVRHGGSLKGVSSAIGFVPELGVGAVVLCNLDGVPAEQILLDAFNACAGLPLGTAAYEPSAPRTAPPVDDLLGDYLSGEPYGRMHLYQHENGELRASVGWPSVDVPAFLAADDEVALVYPDRKAPVRILRGADGAVWGAQSGRVMHRL